MITKLNGYEGNMISPRTHYIRGTGDIYIFEDASKFMVILGDEYRHALINLETGAVLDYGFDLDCLNEHPDLNKYGEIKERVGEYDVVLCKMNNKSKESGKYEKIEHSIDIKAIECGDVFILSDSSKWIIGKQYHCNAFTNKVYPIYFAVNLQNYEMDKKGYYSVINIFNNEFLRCRDVVEIIKSKDIILTYKRRFKCG